ncbi:hypothetical protein BGZ80_009551 [Entomortierella chlamydospora]|uniref:Oligopeptide transporter n=1 Tax=Entomortierella chlamydospora TaxID=101097 RepID=A0A9P6MWW5_9FUNG|nr:hypothetical protein BGZ80_009551 [Entomortierella chlamydospora]
MPLVTPWFAQLNILVGSSLSHQRWPHVGNLPVLRMKTFTRAYPEVPEWWYGILFIITLSLSFVTYCVWDFMPWWGVILALAIAAFFVLPVGIVQAVTNQTSGLSIVTEYVIGYIFPGHAIANVTFKTYGYITNVQALTFVSDLKIGHYMKILHTS